METMIPEIEAKNILLEYNGANNQLLEWKQKFIDIKSFRLSRTQAEYVQKYHEVKPKVARKYIDIVASFGEKLKEDKLLTKTPEKIWCEKLLCESDKAYHIWGKIFDSEHNHSLWLPKSSVLLPEKTIDREIDYSKYNVRPLFEHQKIAVERLLANDRYILADDMGLMKTGSSIVAAIESGAKKILIVCPASLKINWQREIKIYTDRKTLIVEGRKWGSTFDFYIINYDIIKNYHTTENNENSEAYKLIVNEGFDLAIVDECFTYDSKVMTDNGEMYIGDIVENGLDVKILTFNHIENKIEYKPIVRWIRKNKNTIYQIKLNNGLFIECTDNHKFYTKNRGYVKAKDITRSDELYMLSKRVNKTTNSEEGEVLFKKLFSNNKELTTPTEKTGKNILQKMFKLLQDNVLYNGKKNDKTKLLFSKLCEYIKVQQSGNKRKKTENYRKKWWMVESYEEDTQKQSTHGRRLIRKNEKKQSNVKFEKYRENEISVNGENISLKRGKWKINETSNTTSSIIGKRMGDGMCNLYKKCQSFIQEFTSFLSCGYWKQGEKNFSRNRRKNSQTEKMEIFGQEKNRSSQFVRAESFTILERGSYDKSTGMSSKSTRVYDLEIEENHNYFVNGILVSNCHYISNPEANRTKLLNDVLQVIPKVWLLSGTPMTSRPINYFNLLKIIDSPLSLNWQSYVRRYCAGFQFTVTDENGRKRKVWRTNGASHLDELRERSKSHVLRRMKTDILDLPEKLITPIFLDLKSTFYNEELEEFMRITEDKKGDESISVTLNRLMKVRQLIAYEKIPYTCELIDKCLEMDKKVIVFTNFTMTLDMLHEKYKKNSVVLDGRMTKEKKQASVDKFQNDNKIKIFIGNIVAAGVGLTLTAAETVIMNDLSFVPSHHSQAEDRAYRYGQKNNVLVYYPVFENTVEMIIHNILQKKKNIIDQVMGDGEYSESFGKELIKELF